MKLFLKKLEKICSSALWYFELYFLGQKGSRPQDNEDFFITFDNHPVRNPVTLFLGDDGDDFPARHSVTSGLDEGTGVLIAIAPAGCSHLSIKLPDSLSSSFFLWPNYLEQIVPMLHSIERALPGKNPLVVVLFYISQMPCKKELLSCISSSTIHSYDQAYMAFLLQIKRIVSKQKLILIIDREETLGQKNSALLKRMFSNT